MSALRILYFADIRFPLERANGIQTAETCHALARRGHDIRLVVRPDTASEPRDPWDFYGLPRHERLALVRVRTAGNQAVRRAIYLSRAVTLVLNARPGVVFTRDLGVASLLLRLPASRRPPLVHESHGLAPVVSQELPALLSNRSIAASTAKLGRLMRRERRVWMGADGYVTITRALACDLAAAFGHRMRPAEVIPDGVRIDGRRSFDLPVPGPAPVVCYAGHLYPWKGVDVLLEALAMLPFAHGLIVGGLEGEPDLARTKEKARELGIDGRVEFTGAVQPREVRRFLERASVLVLPNRPNAISTRYTSPLKLFEYLEVGRPIVASDLPALREVLEDGRNAVLAPAGDAQALAGAIGRILEDRDLAERIARQAFEDASAFSWDRRAERLEALMIPIAERTASA